MKHDLIQRYLHLTRAVMPELARDATRGWPVRHDHCFQRIVLDTICDGVWYDHIARPARANLTPDMAHRAVSLCEAIIGGEVDLAALNRQSLRWCGKL